MCDVDKMSLVFYIKLSVLMIVSTPYSIFNNYNKIFSKYSIIIIKNWKNDRKKYHEINTYCKSSCSMDFEANVSLAIDFLRLKKEWSKC